MTGKLNIFQRTMLQWNEVYPYNAVHVIRVPQRLEIERLTDVINGHLNSYGLNNLVIDVKKKAFHYHGGFSRHVIKVIGKEKNVKDALRNEIEIQLNTPFDAATTINPFRFFAVSEEDFFYLGLVYLHLISAAESIIFLLKGIVNVYTGKDGAVALHRPDIYPATYFQLSRIGPKSLFGWLYTFPSFISALRRSYRPGYEDIGEHSNGFSSFSVDARQFHSLVVAGKKWGVTLNDIFLALLLKSVSPFARERIDAPRRKMISVASIVNIRKDLSLDLRDPFGLFLGSFIVSHAVPGGISIENLAKDVNRQTLRIKKYRLYMRTAVGLGLARMLMHCLSPHRREKFYPKYYPLWGGITNVNMNALLRERDENIPSDYFRAVSTGPVTPLVLSITTVQDILNIGVSFKKTVFSKRQIDQIIAEISKCISGLEV